MGPWAAQPGDVNDSMLLEATGVELEEAAAVLAALADPARLRILAVLADAGRCVCDIRTAVPIAANLLSYHLRVLREAGLVEGSRRGRWIDYQLTAAAGARISGAVAAGGFPANVDQPPGCASECEAPR
jgi:ArsR family transcriptional regulator, arsenate/arsenite/antimonite-responsive transcriptional repressor